MGSMGRLSTTVEITIGYLTCWRCCYSGSIYNSRNYYRLLNDKPHKGRTSIYNSRNYYRLLNVNISYGAMAIYNSRNYYRLLNIARNWRYHVSTTVEITIGYLTSLLWMALYYIYNSRNYYRLLNPIFVFLHNFLSCNHHI